MQSLVSILPAAVVAAAVTAAVILVYTRDLSREGISYSVDIVWQNSCCLSAV